MSGDGAESSAQRDERQLRREEAGEAQAVRPRRLALHVAHARRQLRVALLLIRRGDELFLRRGGRVEGGREREMEAPQL